MSYLKRLFGLSNKVAVVTGATGQLGNVLCNAFQQAGTRTVGLDMNIGNNLNGKIDYCHLDITDKQQIREVFDTIIKKYGSLDILVNNAGVSTFEPFEQRPEESFDHVMDVNLKGTFLCIQEHVNIVDKYKQAGGCIINIGSIFGVVSPDFRNYTDCDRRSSEVYGATKAGVIQMTKYFAVHLAERNIRVNAVSPGGIFNPKAPQGEDFIKNYSFRCPMKRMANDDEMIGAVLYLSSDSASYTTGQNIIVDGGLSCW
jgi:NAD(P)-dependent dehydrogenase (short-subunit alcohol dehydrogenase family)